MKGVKRMDENDWRLLQELQQNAMTSSPRLAEKLGLSAQVVRRKRQRMEQAGIISGYHAEVDPRKLGLEVSAIVRLSVNGENFGRLRKVIESSPQPFQCDHTLRTN